MICPCCETEQKRFDSYRGRANAVCPECGALERHRLLWLYLEREVKIQEKRLRILHCSPMNILCQRMREIENLYYVPINLVGSSPDIDLVEIPFTDNFFDIVIVSHVLEHIEDDRKALEEIFRILRPRGCAILLVPMSGLTTKVPEPTEDRCKLKPGTLRIYGNDFKERTEKAGFGVELFDTSHYGVEYGLAPSDHLWLATK